jgi:hypothetical protein
VNLAFEYLFKDRIDYILTSIYLNIISTMSSFSKFMNKKSSLFSTHLGLGVNIFGSIVMATSVLPLAFFPFIDTGFDGKDIGHITTVMTVYPLLYTGSIITMVWPSVFTTIIGTRLISSAIGFSEELSPKWSMTNRKTMTLILKTNLVIGIMAPILCWVGSYP